MGAWGTGIRQNDTALDFIGNIIDKAFNKARENEEYLVVLELEIECGTIEENRKPQYLEVIQDEINKIESWSEECREERLLILGNLKNEILTLE